MNFNLFKLKCITIFCFLSLLLNAQEEITTSGVLYLEDGMKIEGGIDNGDWSETPSKIIIEGKEYDISRIVKLDISRPDGESYTMYKKEVDLETSPAGNAGSGLEWSPSLEIEKKIIFLKLVLDGEVRLYEHRYNNRLHFFIEKEGKITPMLYKRYSTGPVGNLQPGVKEKKVYPQQLSELFSDCESIKKKKLIYVRHTSESFISIIKEYSLCKGNEIVDKSSKRKRRIRLQPYLSTGIVRNKYKTILTERPNVVHNKGWLPVSELGFRVEMDVRNKDNSVAVLLGVGYRNELGDDLSGENLVRPFFSRTTEYTNRKGIDFYFLFKKRGLFNKNLTFAAGPLFNYNFEHALTKNTFLGGKVELVMNYKKIEFFTTFNGAYGTEDKDVFGYILPDIFRYQLSFGVSYLIFDSKNNWK